MKKLTKSERAVVERLIFPESFEVIMEETKMQFGELRDDLMNLVNYRFIEVIDDDSTGDSKMAFYDSDNIRDFSFRATKTGLKSIKQTTI
jgi:plasmid replication initiation protein